MKWVILGLVILFFAALFGAPFIELLAPNANIYLIQHIPEKNDSILLAQGPETLWAQWQNWTYIAVFCLIVCLTGSVISSMFQEKTNLEIEERKATLDAKIKEQQTLNDSYRRKVEQKIREELENEYQEKREWIQRKNTEQYRISEQLQTERQINENLRERATILNKQTNLSNQHQERSNRSKLAQRDRLSEQKRLLVNYLEHADWQWSTGEKVTYQSLLKEAKKHP
jgi:hypothetical protein